MGKFLGCARCYPHRLDSVSVSLRRDGRKSAVRKFRICDDCIDAINHEVGLPDGYYLVSHNCNGRCYTQHEIERQVGI